MIGLFFFFFCSICLADADGPIFITSLSLTLDGSGVHASKRRAMDMISSYSFALCRQKTFKKQLGQGEREEEEEEKRFSTSSALPSLYKHRHEECRTTLCYLLI